MLFLSCSGSVVAFKALLAGAPQAASLDRAEVKGISSGSYTVWRDFGDGIGVSQTNTPTATTIQDCLLACDRQDACAGVYMMAADANVVSPNLSTCRLIQGQRIVGSPLRSVTRVVTTRLASANITETLSLA